MDYCFICSRPAEEVHHALWGNKHKLADQDHLLLPLCAYHHNSMNLYEVKRKPITNMSVHHNEEMRILSQALAQACWERQWIAEHCNDCTTSEELLEQARTEFRKRYGESYM